jgi:hypothetical protein
LLKICIIFLFISVALFGNEVLISGLDKRKSNAENTYYLEDTTKQKTLQEIVASQSDFKVAKTQNLGG